MTTGDWYSDGKAGSGMEPPGKAGEEYPGHLRDGSKTRDCACSMAVVVGLYFDRSRGDTVKLAVKHVEA